MLSLEEAIQKKQSPHTFRCIVNHINLSKVKPPRAGVIPYISTPQGLKYAFGLDTNYRELTDFGGGVSYKRDKTAINGALREFKEESLGVFGDYTPKDVMNNVVIYNKDLMIVFIPVDVSPKEKNALFHKRLEDEDNPEVCDIVWLSEDELDKALDSKSRLIYMLVKDLITNADNFSKLLKE